MRTGEVGRPGVMGTEAGIEARLVEWRTAAQGPADQHGRATSVMLMLVHRSEPKVLMMQQSDGKMVALSGALDNQCKVSLNDMAYGVHRVLEQVGGPRFSMAARRCLLRGEGVWGAHDPASRSFVFVHRVDEASLMQSTRQPLHWVALDDLQSKDWCQQHCTAALLSQLATARPLLEMALRPKGVGHNGSSDSRALVTEISKLEVLRKDLTRHQGLLAVAKGMLRRCQYEGNGQSAVGASVTLTDTYVYRGTGGRRYPESAPLDTEEEQLWERRTATLTRGAAVPESTTRSMVFHRRDAAPAPLR